MGMITNGLSNVLGRKDGSTCSKGFYDCDIFLFCILFYPSVQLQKYFSTGKCT